jgi:hypothetical protein
VFPVEKGISINPNMGKRGRGKSTSSTASSKTTLTRNRPNRAKNKDEEDEQEDHSISTASTGQSVSVGDDKDVIPVVTTRARAVSKKVTKAVEKRPKKMTVILSDSETETEDEESGDDSMFSPMFARSKETNKKKPKGKRNQKNVTKADLKVATVAGGAEDSTASSKSNRRNKKGKGGDVSDKTNVSTSSDGSGDSSRKVEAALARLRISESRMPVVKLTNCMAEVEKTVKAKTRTVNKPFVSKEAISDQLFEDSLEIMKDYPNLTGELEMTGKITKFQLKSEHFQAVEEKCMRNIIFMISWRIVRCWMDGYNSSSLYFGHVELIYFFQFD